jgi:hypothetical protein
MRPSTRALLPLVAVALLASACTRTKTSTSTTVSGTPVLTQMPAPAPRFDPSGKWSVALIAQGQSLELTLSLEKKDDAGNYTGTFTSDMFPPMALTSAKLDGTKMVLTVPVPTGDLATMNLVFDGDLMSGEWSMPGDGSKLSGKRL